MAMATATRTAKTRENNNFARAARFFVNFLAVFARLQKIEIHVFCYK